MNTVQDILTRLKTEIGLVSTSTLVSDETLIAAISDAQIWAGDQFDWPQLEKGKRTQTAATVPGIVDEYYSYPAEFKSDSVYHIQVDGKTYDPKSWDSYQKTKRVNNLAQDERIFATFARQYFLNPLPTAAGLTLDVWGRIQAPPLAELTDKTIFSDSEASLNEGILRKAFAIVIASTDKNRAISEEGQALINLAGGFKKILNRRAMFQEKNMPRFAVGDMFATKGVSFAPGNTGGGQ